MATLPDTTCVCNVYDDVIHCKAPPPNLNSANIFKARFWGQTAKFKWQAIQYFEMGWSGISLSYTSICITVLNFESGISLACLFWVAALYIPHKHSQNLYLIIFNVVCLLCVKIVQIGCLRCIDKSSQRMFSPTKMQTIWDLYWLKGIRKAAAWGQLCCKTIVCTLIRTALCSGSSHIS